MLRVIDAEPTSSTVIERLGEALEEARAGRISSVGIAIVYRDGSIGGCWSDCPSRPAMLGSLSHLSHRLNADLHG